MARALDMVRLGDFASAMPAQLSGGQQQRVALARAAVYDPPLLLMDEPLGALDKNLREEMQEELRQFHRNVGATILYVTHDQQEAAIDGGSDGDHEPRRRSSRSARRRGVRTAGQQLRRALPRGGEHVPPCWDVEEAGRYGQCACETEEGLALLAAGQAARPVSASARRTSPSARHRRGGENCFPGRIVDIVHVAGSIRYRVAIAPGCIVTARVGRSGTP